MAPSFYIFFPLCIVATNAASVLPSNFEIFADPIENERIQVGDPVEASKFAGALVYYYDGKYQYPFCTSSLITPDRVLSAAHCFEPWMGHPRAGLKFVFGLSDIREESINANANNPNVSIISFNYTTDLFSHENYTGLSNMYLNDIAIIKLSQPVTAPQAEPITLARKEYTTQIYDVGWGRKDCVNASVETLRKAQGRILPQKSCNSSLLNARKMIEFYDSQLCAFFSVESQESAAVAPGDSGGPLFHVGDGSLRIQIGVTSNVVFYAYNYEQGWRCVDPNTPQTFTRVSSFESWIKGHAPEAKFA